MLYTYPDYYSEFHCIADACEDTCCAGWQIVVDDRSLRRYHCEDGPYKKKLHASVNWRQKVFRQDKEARCAFLCEDNLCDMYRNLGADSLCRTCRLYPRHIEEFEGIREISLSISCPEAAHLLIERREPVTFHSVEKEGTEEYEDYDPFLYSMLADARECLFEILQNRNLPMENRILLSLGVAYDMENRVAGGKLFECEAVFEKYRKQTWFFAAGMKADKYRKDMKKRYLFSREMFGNLRELELLRKDWEYQLNEAEILLFAYGADGYGKIQEAFYQWEQEQRKSGSEDAGETETKETEGRKQEKDWDWNIFSEQLMVYFIFTYFCGAVYDGEIFVNVQMAAASVSVIWDLLAVRWLKNEKTLDAEDVKEVVYRYSRELEHSDKNKAHFREKLKKQSTLFYCL
ncbi:flagellin lysine-N-methylase [Mediterraneibacter agrestimuris]|uniref:flagellin lysine-N-methylase n=1 Tax=Mediterraneibacter agrestimuris TaxID=2941333 RepID=UPI00203B272C|nr:flagellin lysine-N-methylase [Mediterraneibacter agrestimuris]